MPLPDSERVKHWHWHRMQVASQYCAGVASCTVPTDAKLDLTNNEAVSAVCIRLGLPLPGLTSATRCLRNCALMGPRAELDEATESESIITGRHFLGCAACGTYCRQNGVVQALHDFFRLEMCFSESGRTRTVGEQKCWQAGQLGPVHRWTGVGKPAHRGKIAFDVGIVEPNSNSHSARSGCNQSFLNVNAGTSSCPARVLNKLHVEHCTPHAARHILPRASCIVPRAHCMVHARSEIPTSIVRRAAVAVGSPACGSSQEFGGARHANASGVGLLFPRGRRGEEGAATRLGDAEAFSHQHGIGAGAAEALWAT